MAVPPEASNDESSDAPPGDVDCLDPDVMTAFAHGRVEPAELQQVEEHIDRCAECRRCVSELVKSLAEPGAADPEGPTWFAPGPAGGFSSHGAPEDTLSGPSGRATVPEVAARYERFLPQGAALGRYVIDGLLGAGGMGVVYAAFDPKLDRKVALKMLRAASPSGPEARERLLREARAMARLAHPNVVSVYDVDVHEGQLFLAMEHVEGVTLRSWLRRESRPTREVLRALVRAGRGIAAAHAVGVVHRDVKPENVLVGPRGRVCVTDFGLARSARPSDPLPDEAAAEVAPPEAQDARTTRTGALLGTPAYMAPEQHLGRPADEMSDQFGFCVMLYEALYDERPFDGQTWGALAEAVTGGKVREPPARAAVPSRVRRAMLRGLSVNPRERFASMDELLAALSDERAARRRWALSAGGAVAVLSALALGHRYAGPAARPTCEGVERRFSSAWDEGRKGAVRGAFLATGKPFAADAWREVERTLDGYARDWAASRVDACEATHVRGEQSATLLDLRMACLDDRLKEAGALADVFARADAEVVVKAVEAAHALSPLAPCADARALLSRVEPPADAATAAKVEEARAELSRAKALSDAGKYREALALAAEVARRAEAVDYPPLRAEALLREGRLQASVSDMRGSLETMRRAAAAADATGDDAARAEALTQLFIDASFLQTNEELASVFDEQARAAVARLGGAPGLDGRRRIYAAHALRARGKLDEALREIQVALPLLEGAFGPDSKEASQGRMVLGNTFLDLNDYAAASAVLGRALESAERTRGRDHPDAAIVLDGIGRVLAQQLRFDEATPHFERALRIQEAAIGADSLNAATYAHDFANALGEFGRYERALPYLRRALSIYEAKLGPENPRTAMALCSLGEALLELGDRKQAAEHLERAARQSNNLDTVLVLAQVRFALARALSESGGDRRRARALAAAARDAYRALPQPTPLEARTTSRIERWLERHPRG